MSDEKPEGGGVTRLSFLKASAGTDEEGAGRSPMHVISRKKLVAFWTAYHDAKAQLAAWFKVAAKAN